MLKEIIYKLGVKGMVGLVALETFEILFWIMIFVAVFR